MCLVGYVDILLHEYIVSFIGVYDRIIYIKIGKK